MQRALEQRRKVAKQSSGERIVFDDDDSDVERGSREGPLEGVGMQETEPVSTEAHDLDMPDWMDDSESDNSDQVDLDADVEGDKHDTEQR